MKFRSAELFALVSLSVSVAGVLGASKNEVPEGLKIDDATVQDLWGVVPGATYIRVELKSDLRKRIGPYKDLHGYMNSDGSKLILLPNGGTSDLTVGDYKLEISPQGDGEGDGNCVNYVLSKVKHVWSTKHVYCPEWDSDAIQMDD